MTKKIISKDAPVNELLGKLKSEPEQEEQIKGQLSLDVPTPPAGYKVNPLYVETKTARMQFVFKPSTVARLKEYCKGQKISVNKFVEELIDQALNERNI